MLKQRRLIADQVAATLFEAESAIDAALGKAAALAGVMPSMRVEAGISALVGQGAVEWASKSITALTEARRAIVEAHKELSVAQKQIGLGAVMFGEPDKPEDPGVRALQAVPSVIAKAS
jgi:hypothetical protein